MAYTDSHYTVLLSSIFHYHNYSVHGIAWPHTGSSCLSAFPVASILSSGLLGLPLYWFFIFHLSLYTAISVLRSSVFLCLLDNMASYYIRSSAIQLLLQNYSVFWITWLPIISVLLPSRCSFKTILSSG